MDSNSCPLEIEQEREGWREEGEGRKEGRNKKNKLVNVIDIIDPNNNKGGDSGGYISK